MASWNKALDRLEGAFSDHTLRAYRSDFAGFAKWCREKRQPALPASPQTVARYLEDKTERLKPSTLKRRLCAVRKVHRLTDHPDPTNTTEVELAIRRARRLQPSRPNQALGLTAQLRDQLLEVCSDDLIGLRDKVLVSVGFDTLCRRGELVAISVEDLTLTGQGRYSVLVRRAKNDPHGTGRICHLSSLSCSLINAWLTASGAETGPLVWPVYGQGALPLFLEPLTVSRVLKKLAERAKLYPSLVQKVSGHSLRVGAAQQLALDGRGLLQIMRVGGWRSPNVVARYVENMDLDVWS